MPENINSANYSTLKDLWSNPRYLSKALPLNRTDNWLVICDLCTHLLICHSGHSSDTLDFLPIETFVLGLDTEENLGSERSHKPSCSSFRSVFLQCHSVSDLILPPLPSPEEMTNFILLYFYSQHRVLPLPTHHISIPLYASCRNVRLGEIFSDSVCGKAVFWHFTKTASRIQIRTSHFQRKILTLTSTIFSHRFVLCLFSTKMNQSKSVSSSKTELCSFIFSNTITSQVR